MLFAFVDNFACLVQPTLIDVVLNIQLSWSKENMLRLVMAERLRAA